MNISMNTSSEYKRNMGIFFILTSIILTVASWTIIPGLKNFYANSSGTLLSIPSIIEFLLNPFLHVNFFHLFGNMLLLLFIWQLFAQNISKNQIIPFFLLSEAFQYLGVVLRDNPPTAGMSGFIFSIFGYMTLCYYLQKNPEYKGILFYTAISFSFWIFQDPTAEIQISYTGHLIGFITGIFWYACVYFAQQKK